MGVCVCLLSILCDLATLTVRRTRPNLVFIGSGKKEICIIRSFKFPQHL